MQLYQNIYAYKIMKNDNFNLKRNISKCKNENLINCVVFPSTLCLTCTVSKQLNKDAKNKSLFDERSRIRFMQTPQIKD